jgi:RNA polymerase sigma-70 factor (ECF subfamily)
LPVSVGETRHDGVEDFGQVAAAFASLSDDDRELLALVGWEGLDRHAIATVLGCSRATVRVRLHRARSRFAVALQQHGVDPQRWGGSGHTQGRRLPSCTSTEGTL